MKTRHRIVSCHAGNLDESETRIVLVGTGTSGTQWLLPTTPREEILLQTIEAAQAAAQYANVVTSGPPDAEISRVFATPHGGPETAQRQVQQSETTAGPQAAEGSTPEQRRWNNFIQLKNAQIILNGIWFAVKKELTVEARNDIRKAIDSCNNYMHRYFSEERKLYNQIARANLDSQKGKIGPNWEIKKNGPTLNSLEVICNKTYTWEERTLIASLRAFFNRDVLKNKTGSAYDVGFRLKTDCPMSSYVLIKPALCVYLDAKPKNYFSSFDTEAVLQKNIALSRIVTVLPDYVIELNLKDHDVIKTLLFTKGDIKQLWNVVLGNPLKDSYIKVFTYDNIWYGGKTYYFEDSIPVEGQNWPVSLLFRI